ncbi:CaiB/BaiF CoA transferase family protein [Vreelandella titanicae]|uniref:CoA-transferase family III n=1 Tax=Vreelandella titanicae BH1 TaxID=1204738 RepID=L9U5T1_9GAMM|nr:CaiB/BaiF CoA-transferase family protein [Halomonas titanicae]ELY20229.1 CoA-transferase family III [Halomonas titanicae BH1]
MTSYTTASGPLHGIKVIEVEGIGGSPFAAMLLADMGAEVVRIERPQRNSAEFGGTDPGPVLGRGRRSIIGLNLKSPDGLSLLLDLVREADVLIEAFRPGVAERLGFGPDAVHDRNPRLIYGRLTGWGRTGPLAHTAGHDINYTALAGVLGAIGRKDSPPAPPLALTGDMGGGGLVLAFGILAALFERHSSGRGQVVDAAMVDGAALLMSAFWGFHGRGLWNVERESNPVDGGAPYYDTYKCKDGRYISIGALEPQFYTVLCDQLGIDVAHDREKPDAWPRQREELRVLFLSRTCEEWCRLLEGTDACFAPVLNFETAPSHPHLQARDTFIKLGGIVQPAPAPRLSRTPATAQPAPVRFATTRTTLNEWGIEETRILALLEAGILQ